MTVAVVDMKPEAVVVLGLVAGGRHSRLLRAARERGFVVLGVDEDAVLDAVAEWSARYRVRGVLVFGESFVEAGAVLADQLGLPGVGVRARRDKPLRHLAPWSPRSVLADRPGVADWWMSFPCVLKPLDGRAGAGVRRLDSVSELKDVLAVRDLGVPLLVEELVVGHEVRVESLVRGGEVRFSDVTGTLADTDQRAAVLAVHAEVLTRLSFQDVIVHAEYRVAGAGTVRLMEIAIALGEPEVVGVSGVERA